MQRDWRATRLFSIQIFLIYKVHKNFSLTEIKLKLYMSAYLLTMVHYFLITIICYHWPNAACSWQTVAKGLLVASILLIKMACIHCKCWNINHYRIVQEISILLSKLNTIAHFILQFISWFLSIFITLQSLIPFLLKSHYCSQVLTPSYKKLSSIRGLISHTQQLEIHSSVSNQDKYVINRTCHTLYFALQIAYLQ